MEHSSHNPDYPFDLSPELNIFHVHFSGNPATPIPCDCRRDNFHNDNVVTWTEDAPNAERKRTRMGTLGSARIQSANGFLRNCKLNFQAYPILAFGEDKRCPAILNLIKFSYAFRYSYYQRCP